MLSLLEGNIHVRGIAELFYRLVRGCNSRLECKRLLKPKTTRVSMITVFASFVLKKQH